MKILSVAGIVADVQPSVTAFNAFVGGLKKATAQLKISLTRWIDLVSLIASLIFFWLILAQSCLFIHSWDQAS